MSEAWKAGSTRRWRRVRALVLARDRGVGCRAHADGWCDRAGLGEHVCRGRAEVAHHTLGRARTGDDVRYLVGACAPCNLKIGDPLRSGDPINKAVTKW